MKLHFATVPAREPGTAADELNAFLASHRIVGVEKHLVGEADSAYWAVCITYAAGAERSSATNQPARRSRVDYREVLNDGDFAVFAELRKLRKEFAEREAVPPYAIFNNEQLATMVTQRVRTIADFESISGIGQARVDRYATAFLQRLQALQNESPKDAPSDANNGS